MGQHQEPDQKLHTGPSPGVTDGYRGVGGSRRFAVPESQPVSKEFCCFPLQVQMTLLFTWTPFLLTVPGIFFPLRGDRALERSVNYSSRVQKLPLGRQLFVCPKRLQALLLIDIPSSWIHPVRTSAPSSPKLLLLLYPSVNKEVLSACSLLLSTCRKNLMTVSK